MLNIITDVSKYLMFLLMVFYTFFNFIALRVRNPRRVAALCRWQLFYAFFMFLLGFLIITLNYNSIKYPLFGVGTLAIFIAYYNIYRKIYPDASPVIITNTVMLLGLGLMLLARLNFDKALVQLGIGTAAMAVTLAIPAIIKHFKALAKFAVLYAVIGIGLLVLVWRMGNTTLGAQLSFTIGSISLQPSEFVKISYVFFAAAMLREKNSFGRALVTTLIAAAHVLVLVASTDLGSGLVYFISFVFMLFVATHQPLYIAAGLGAGAGAAVVAYNVFDHVRIRVQMWINPFTDYNDKGYQLAQSLFAISAGGFFGVGLCRGYPESIPLVRNDYIFSAICEELGILFAACVILIYLGFLISLFRVSTRLTDKFYQIIGVGFATMMGTQIFLHIGGVTKLIPATGITLPLISYGGSSVLSTMIIIGVIQGLNIKSDGLTPKQRARQELSDLNSLAEGGADS